ncbi:PAQR family membrane homeostasis protein TrhA [Microlunatus flavus]|uniref:Hemolysin III n=1 Tax=Microlunatus flavus TaxID=1036181 RepID=A0A1H9K9W6_9ACTN|nr:hemolysin III family protein [Microlunatus flavus]SEQ95996.1 hemolysin III [Microlunatus flavus]
MPTTTHDRSSGQGHDAADGVGEVVRQVKPKLRGWLHAGMAPLALAAGIVLVVLAPTAAGVVGGAVFLAASVLLFGTSGLYHRFYWGARGEAVLRRMDHANIYVFIAATYTPLALLLLHGGSRVALLVMIWTSALGGLLFRTLWLSAPRWLYTALYLLMAWAAVGWMGAFYRTGGATVVTLILVGGVFYTVGAVVYGRKSPDPSPRWFGFHEIFHACTIAGFVCHYVAISVVTYAAR